MTKRWGWRCLAAGILLVAASQTTAAAKTESHRVKSWAWTFQADTLGQKPEHSGVATGTWKVANLGAVPPDSGAAGERMLQQVEGDDGADYHMLQLRKPVVGDLVASLRFRVVSGEEDPGAGLLFHLDEKARNGYLIRVSGAKGRVIAHYLIAGRRRDIRWAPVDAPKPGEWHTLSVTKTKSVIVVSYDGVERLRFRDERYTKGNVGFWTEEDAVVDFADLKVALN